MRLKLFLFCFALTSVMYSQWVDQGTYLTTSDRVIVTEPWVTKGELEIQDATFGTGSDKNAFYRDDEINDYSYLKLQLGDEQRSKFEIGYKRYQDGTWVPNFILDNGKIGIGIQNPQNALDVNGKIHAKEVKVDLTGWADFVFKSNYNITPILEVEQYILQNGHLEGIKTEEEVLQDGLELGETNIQFLQKIEELTLYTIQQEKRINSLEKQVEALLQLNKKLLKLSEQN